MRTALVTGATLCFLACAPASGTGQESADTTTGDLDADRCQPGPASPYTFTLEGTNYLIDNGDLFTVEGGDATFVLDLYEPTYFDTMYERVDGELFAVSGSELLPIQQSVIDTFPIYSSIAQMFPTDGSGWHHMTAQSPAFPTIEDYGALFECIIAGTCEFVDNRMDLLPVLEFSDSSVRFQAVAATEAVNPSKMSIANRLICFAKGEDIWVRFSARTGDVPPSTILDIESQNIYQSGGPRLTIFDGSLGYQLKFADNPSYQQIDPIPWPSNEWVNVKLHLHLDETDEGLIQVWQNGALVIDTKGKTLPLADLVLNELEVGISATQEASQLDITNLVLSPDPL